MKKVEVKKDSFTLIQVISFETRRIFNFAYSPDGKQLAHVCGSVKSDVVLIKNSE
jgi:hypothetical protein